MSSLGGSSNSRVKSPLRRSDESMLLEDFLLQIVVAYIKFAQMVRFEIGRQKFMELLESMNVREALSVLRNELTPLGVETDTLHTLSTYFLFLSPEELRKTTQWDGAAGNSRKLLLKKLHSTTRYFHFIFLL